MDFHIFLKGDAFTALQYFLKATSSNERKQVANICKCCFDSSMICIAQDESYMETYIRFISGIDS